MTTTDIENEKRRRTTPSRPTWDVRREGEGSSGEPRQPTSVPAAVPAWWSPASRRRTAVLEPSSRARSPRRCARGVLLPLLLPIVSAAAIVFYVDQPLAALLAGGEWGSLVIASILMLVDPRRASSWISAPPDLRTSTLAVMVAVLFLFVGASRAHHARRERGQAGAARRPAGLRGADRRRRRHDRGRRPRPTLKFQATNFDTVGRRQPDRLRPRRRHAHARVRREGVHRVRARGEPGQQTGLAARSSSARAPTRSTAPSRATAPPGWRPRSRSPRVRRLDGYDDDSDDSGE